MLPTKEQLEAAREVVAAHMAPTAHIRWPLLASRTGAEVWVKHENHTPIGAFKIRGGLNYMNKLKAEQPGCPAPANVAAGSLLTGRADRAWRAAGRTLPWRR